jgi:cyclase
LNGGRQETELELFTWAEEAVKLGSGELLFTSMDHDGTKNGFAIQALKSLSERVNVPVIASGGCGTITHFVEVFKEAHVDAALAASVFHFGEIQIRELKNELTNNGIAIRNMLYGN